MDINFAAWGNAGNACALYSVCFLQLITLSIPISATTKLESNAVNVSLYLVKLSQWDSMAKVFENIILSEANLYCSVNPKECGFNTWEDSMKFHKSDESIQYLNTPVYISYALEIRYALWMPLQYIETANETVLYVPKPAVTEITLNSRHPLSSLYGVEISSIGSEHYGPIPDLVVNGVICGVAVISCLGLALTIVLLDKFCGDHYDVYVPSKKEPDKTVKKDFEKDAEKDVEKPIEKAVDEDRRTSNKESQEAKMSTIKVPEESQNGSTPVLTVMNAQSAETEAPQVAS